VNDSEAETVSRMVRLIDAAREGFDETLTMGVITPYADQMRMIRRMLRMDDERSPDRLRLRNFLEKGEERFMVKSVDDFQGDERDVIILSLVRTTESRFISDFRRINVAMSRARRLLVIVGNADSLADVAVDVDGDGTLRNVYKDIIDDLKMDGRVVDSEEVPE
jgi:superfamily I DNA and/or RNA helicase